MAIKLVLLIKICIITAVIAVFCFYFYKQAESYLTGPRFAVDYPEDGQTVNDSFLIIKGKSINISDLRVNGRQIAVGDTGNFETGLLLAKGYNIIGISAEDKFGRVINKKLEVVFQ